MNQDSRFKCPSPLSTLNLCASSDLLSSARRLSLTMDDLEKYAKLLFFGDKEAMLQHWGNMNERNSEAYESVQADLVDRHRDGGGW